MNEVLTVFINSGILGILSRIGRWTTGQMRTRGEFRLKLRGGEGSSEPVLGRLGMLTDVHNGSIGRSHRA